jgi:predicted dehydrogenase
MDTSTANVEDRGSGVGVGVIGAGNVVWAYLQVLDRLVPRGLAWEGPICARRRDAWPGILARRPGANLVPDAEQVLESDVSVVVIITPPDTHASYARAALEAGKHVVCEKPVGMSRAEAEPVFGLAASRGLRLLAAPFVQLSPTFRELWTRVHDGEIGHVHSGRGLYGNAGSTWAAWLHEGGVGPLAEAGVYNLKSLTALIGPVTEVFAADAVAVPVRDAEGRRIERPDPDVSHVILRHVGGALSSVTSGQAMQRYRRPGLELYGTEGTANLLGDDWDPTGLEIWRNRDAAWTSFDPIDATWLWADGLREAVVALTDDREPLTSAEHDLHLLDVIDAARVSTSENRPIQVTSGFGALDLGVQLGAARHLLHDHTRSADEQ